MTKITYAAVKTAVEANKEITNRGDMVRAAAAALETTYGNIFTKVVRAEKELGLTLTTRKGRRPGAKTVNHKAALITTFTVFKSKTGEIVAEGLTLGDAEAMVAKAKKAKKASLGVR